MAGGQSKLRHVKRIRQEGGRYEGGRTELTGLYQARQASQLNLNEFLIICLVLSDERAAAFSSGETLLDL